MQVKIYNSIEEIDEIKWDEIVGRNRIICTHRFLEAIEKSNINDCKYFYPVVYDNDKIIAHTCAYTISMELDVLAKGIAKKIINIIRKVWKNFLIIKLVECGTPIALGNTISFADGIDKNLAFSLIIKEIENIAKTKKIGIVLIRDFYEDEICFFDNLINKGYKRVNNLPNTILKVKWNSFEEYLRNLRSHYRDEIKKNSNVAKEKNLTIEISAEFSNLSESLQILWQNVYNQAKEYKREILTKEFFANMDKYLGNKSKVILFKNNLDIIAFALIAIDDDTLRPLFGGIDYIYNKKFAIYYNILYNVIKLAIDSKKKDIDFGITTYFPKMSMGAELVNLYMYMKHSNKLLNPIVTNLFKIITPKIKTKEQHVFKQKNQNKFA